MIEKLFISFVYDLLNRLGHDFFSKEEKTLDALDFDGTDLLILKSEKDFLIDFKKALSLLTLSSNSKKEESALLKCFTTYLSNNIIPVFDKISVKFFIANADEKTTLLEKIFTDQGKFIGLLKNFLGISTIEESHRVFSMIAKKAYLQTQNVIIQSAAECTPSLKNEIRKHFGQKTYVAFQVNSSLLGGMLVYNDGRIIDSSWLGKISSLRKLKPNY